MYGHNIKRTQKSKQMQDNLSKVSYPKPLIKWVGGKTQLLEKLMKKFPQQINNYYEIFLGGGSILFAVLHLRKLGVIHIEGKIHAYDLNSLLITFYKTVQAKPNELYGEVDKRVKEYNSIEDEESIQKTTNTTSSDPPTKKSTKISEKDSKLSKENYYYWCRKVFNDLCNVVNPDEETKLRISAYLLFLNKTCFRGLYREGPNGFNVPYGNYKKPEVINKEHLMEIHELIQDVEFECCDFEISLNREFKTNDFVYLDPPYAPENKTSFVNYTENGFDLGKHIKLFDLCHELTNQKIKFIMNNADVDAVVHRFSTHEYKLESLACKRTINSKNPESKTMEVIIMN
jgi:DNA adenine methylase